jgi:hypothetical protein
MTVFVRSKIARRRKKKSSEGRDRLALPVGTKKRFLDDFFRRFTRPDEAPNVPVQCLAALCEELRENIAGGLRHRRHSRVIRSMYATPIRGYTATLATRVGVFVLSGVVSIADHPIDRIGQITEEIPPLRRAALEHRLPRSMGQATRFGRILQEGLALR